MDNRDFETQNEYLNEKPKTFWKTFGTICLALFLAVLTVLVINL